LTKNWRGKRPKGLNWIGNKLEKKIREYTKIKIHTYFELKTSFFIDIYSNWRKHANIESTLEN